MSGSFALCANVPKVSYSSFKKYSLPTNNKPSLTTLRRTDRDPARDCVLPRAAWSHATIHVWPGTGGGRVEDFAGLAIILTILTSALVAAYESVQRIFHP
jgi:hypothetical protein